MTTLLFTFLISLTASLLLTPLVARLGLRLGYVDKPSARKVHKKPIPRIGGIAIFLAFYTPFLGLFFHQTNILGQLVSKPELLWLLAGSTLVFLMGVVDDIRGLRAGVKFAVQGVAATMAYAAGLSVTHIALPWAESISLGWMSLPLTIFWFLLVVNAVNLIDGLDGLAAGVTLFAALTLLALCFLSQKYLVAVGLAALAGACLGFLRYNFNPASIFMGDCGSYFLGYMLAALSILGSFKSQATVAALIPIIALGLPLMDTLLAPVRRFILGKRMFQPDKSHIHHKLLQMGFSHRKAVLVMYSITVFLGFATLVMVNARDGQAGFILAVLAICFIFGIRKLGYLEYVGVDKMMSYLRDVSEEMGFNRDRRTFLSRQIAIHESRDTDELWDRIVEAVVPLQLDYASLRFNGVCFAVPLHDGHYTWKGKNLETRPKKCRHSVMTLELPLADDLKSYGSLCLKKDLQADPISHYTLRRIEHLRRSVVRKLRAFEAAQNPSSEAVPLQSAVPGGMDTEPSGKEKTSRMKDMVQAAPESSFSPEKMPPRHSHQQRYAAERKHLCHHKPLEKEMVDAESPHPRSSVRNASSWKVS